MAQELRTTEPASPSQRALDEAIELAIEGRSLYPDRATFVDADEPHLGTVIRRAIDEDRAVVLAYPDGSTRVLRAEVTTQ